MFCPNCGTEIMKEALFCGNCGFKVEDFVIKTEAPEEKTSAPSFEFTPAQAAPAEPEVITLEAAKPAGEAAPAAEPEVITFENTAAAPAAETPVFQTTQPAAQPAPNYSNPEFQAQNQFHAVDDNSTLATVVKIFMIIGCVAQGWMIIPLAWCIPMTVSVFKSLKTGRPIGMGMKICTLLFVSLVSGICLLCMKDERK